MYWYDSPRGERRGENPKSKGCPHGEDHPFVLSDLHALDGRINQQYPLSSLELGEVLDDFRY
jgi:hypothetical protein